MGNVKSRLFVGLLMVVLISLMALFVFASTLFIPNPVGLSIATGQNLTGTGVNLSYNAAINATAQANIVNVTINFTHSNGSMMRRLVYQNTSAGQTFFGNTSFDTTWVADGIYSIALLIANYSGEVGVNSQQANNTIVIGLRVDNTAPLVNKTEFHNTPSNYSATNAGLNFNDLIFNLTPINLSRDRGNNSNISGQNFTSAVGKKTATVANQTHFFITRINDLNISHVDTVVFSFDNASGADFNITATNKSGWWIVNYNITTLAEGSHAVRVFANDTSEKQNATVSFAFTYDNTAPSASVSCTSSPSQGDTVTCTCTGTDGTSGPRTTEFSGGTNGVSTATWTTTAAGSSGTSVECVVRDHAGHTSAAATGSWTVASSSSGGSGSGGASGGSSSGSSSSAASTSSGYEKKVWTSIAAGESAVVESKNKPNFPVEKVEFVLTKEVYGAWVRVEAVERSDLPAAAASALKGKVNSVIEITKNNVVLKDGTFNAPVVNFKVAKSWLTENNVAQGDVVLMRLVDGTWTELPTTVGTDDGTHIHYKATTPGFSYFVIAEKGAAEAAVPAEVPSETPTTPTGAVTDTPTQPTEEVAPVVEESEGGSSVLLWVVVLGVIVGVVVYFIRRNA